MKLYNVEVGASNTVKRDFDDEDFFERYRTAWKFDTLAEVNEFLQGCQGRISVVDTHENKEIWFGTADEWRLHMDAVDSINKAASHR
jgi:hypothetical protein